MTFGRKIIARSKNPAPKTRMRDKTDDVARSEPEFDLSRARLAIDDGLLMVLGPEGDPVPPATVAALAANQPETLLAFDDDRKVPARRIADVLAAQTGGRLGRRSGEGDGWLETMLGIGPAPAMASGEELEAERDQLEITLFGSELVISTAAGDSFVITAARPGGPAPAVAQLTLCDGTPVGFEDLVTRLRRAAGLDPEVSGEVAELAVPGCGFTRDGDALVLTTAYGEAFCFKPADGATEERVALYTPDGDSAPFARLADALGLGDEADAQPGAVADDDSQAPVDASVPVEAGAAQDDHAQRTAGPARSGKGPARGGPVAAAEADDEVNRPRASQDQGRAALMAGPSTTIGDEETERRGDETGEAGDGEPIFGEDAPEPPGTGPDASNEGSTEDVQNEASDAPGNHPQRTAIPLTCRLGIDDLSNVAVVLIAGVPAGAVLSAGSDNGDGSWVVSPDQLESLAITLPGDVPGRLTLEARLVFVDDRDGTMSTIARDLVVSPEASDAGRLTDSEAGIRLDLEGVVREAAADGAVSAIVVGGLPADAKLSAGLFDDALRSWVVRLSELEDLRLFPGASLSSPLELRVTVVTMDRRAGKPSAATRSIEVGPSPSSAADLADRPAQRAGGIGFFRPLYDRRR